MRPSWIWAPRARAVSRCSSASSSRPRSTASRPDTTRTTTAGSPHTSASSTGRRASASSQRPSWCRKPAARQSRSRAATSSSAARQRSAAVDGQRDHLVAPPVLGQDAPEVEVRAGHVGHVPVALGQLPGEVQLGEGAVGVAGRLERHAEGMAGVALVEGRVHLPGDGHRLVGPGAGLVRGAAPLQRVGVGGQHPGPGRGARRGRHQPHRGAVLDHRGVLAPGPPEEPRPPLVQEPGRGGVRVGVELVDGGRHELHGAREGTGAAGGVRGAQEDVTAQRSLPRSESDRPVRSSSGRPPARAVRSSSGSHSCSASS